MDLTTPGVAKYLGVATSSDKLIKRTDQARDHSKYQGCNRVNRIHEEQEKERGSK
jgi:hypothetical protein